jgi:hypothetical protein
MYEYRPFRDSGSVPRRDFPRNGRNGGFDVIRVLLFELALVVAPFAVCPMRSGRVPAHDENGKAVSGVST